MSEDAIPNLIPVLPELFLLCTILATLMLGTFQREEQNETRRSVSQTVSLLTIGSLTLTLLLLFMLSSSRVTIFADMFITDEYAVYLKSLILLGAIFSIVLSKTFFERHNTARFEYPIFIAFASLGMMLMVSANDLIALYIGIEMQSLSLYVIAAFHRDDIRSSEAGLKYFVLGAVASGLLLYGCSLIYGFSATTNFGELLNFLSQTHINPGIIFGLVFIIAGLAFKVSAVPFHMWTPDVYEGAPTPVTAFFSIAPKIAAIGLFLRVMIGPFGSLIDEWQGIIILISMASMALSAFAAIYQHNIKRLMAYSSIGHVGYALIGLAAGNFIGIRAILIYLLIYLVMNIGAFSCILCLRRDGKMLENITDFAGISKTHPFLALATSVFMFSLAGIPPLAGFFGKLYIFLAAIEAQLVMLAVFGIITSVISAFYYLRIVRLIYFDESTDYLDFPVDRELKMIVAITGIIVILFFVYPSPVISIAGDAANALLDI